MINKQIELKEVGVTFDVNFGETEGVQAGYKEGYKDGEADGHTEGYQEGYAKGEAEGYSKGEADGLTAGKQAEWSDFWDAYQKKGASKNYGYNFNQNGWTDANYNPKYPIITSNTVGSAESIFQWSDITDTKVPIEINSASKANSIFHGCDLLTTIRELFINQYEFDFSNWFKGCKALKYLNIKGQIKGQFFDLSESPELTHDSLMTAVNAFYDYREPVTLADGVTVTDYIKTISTDFSIVAGQEYTLSVEHNGVQIWDNETVTANSQNRIYKTWKPDEVELPSYAAGLFLMIENATDGSIKASANYVNGGQNPAPSLVLSLSTMQATSTHTAKLGTVNLAKLTTAEKAIATQKGWKLS